MALPVKKAFLDSLPARARALSQVPLPVAKFLATSPSCLPSLSCLPAFCTVRGLSMAISMDTRYWETQTPPNAAAAAHARRCFFPSCWGVQTPEGKNVVYYILVLFLQSWTVLCMWNFLENELRKDDLTRKCCTPSDQWISCSFGIDNSTVWYERWKFQLSLSAEEPAAIRPIKIHMCFPKTRLLPHQAASWLKSQEGTS